MKLYNIALMACLAVSLQACKKAPGSVEQTQAEIEPGNVPLIDDNSAGEFTANVSDVVDNSTDIVEAEAEPETIEEPEIFEYVNPNSNRSIYVIRDIETGCEFIQVENNSNDGRSMAFMPRPDRNGKQICRNAGKTLDQVKAGVTDDKVSKMVDK